MLLFGFISRWLRSASHSKMESPCAASGADEALEMFFKIVDPESGGHPIGALLYPVIMGAFKAQGTSLDAWCRENDLAMSSIRDAVFGQSRREVGRANLDRIIDAAGRDFVRIAYRRRLVEHLATIGKDAA